MASEHGPGELRDQIAEMLREWETEPYGDVRLNADRIAGKVAALVQPLIDRLKQAASAAIADAAEKMRRDARALRRRSLGRGLVTHYKLLLQSFTLHAAADRITGTSDVETEDVCPEAGAAGEQVAALVERTETAEARLQQAEAETERLRGDLQARVDDHAMAAKFVGERLGLKSPLPAVTSIGCVQALDMHIGVEISDQRQRAEQAEARPRAGDGSPDERPPRVAAGARVPPGARQAEGLQPRRGGGGSTRRRHKGRVGCPRRAQPGGRQRERRSK